MLRLEGLCFVLVFGVGKQFATMKLQNELGIFEHVAGQDQDDRLVALHKAFLDEFLQSRQCYCRGGLAAYCVGADLGFRLRHLNFADLLDRASRRLNHAQGFLPRGGFADADRSG